MWEAERFALASRSIGWCSFKGYVVECKCRARDGRGKLGSGLPRVTTRLEQRGGVAMAFMAAALWIMPLIAAWEYVLSLQRGGPGGLIVSADKSSTHILALDRIEERCRLGY
jgi:hypothetical protein